MKARKWSVFACMMVLVLALACLLTFLPWGGEPAAAVEYTWEDTGGPDDSTIRALAWDGSSIYAGSGGGVWRYDPDTGVWTNMGLPGYSYEVTDLAVGGTSLYAAAGSYVWRCDLATGAWTDISGGLPGELWGPGTTAVSSLAWDGSRLYAQASQMFYPPPAGVYNVNLWRYDPASGLWTLITMLAPAGKMGAEYELVYDGDYLYGAFSTVWRYDPKTGAFVDISGALAGKAISSLAWTGECLYAGMSSYNGVWRYDPSTNDWADTGGAVSGEEIDALAWDGDLLYAAGWNGVWSYDAATSTWSDIGTGIVFLNTRCSLVCDGFGLYAAMDFENRENVYRYGEWTGPSLSGVSPASGYPGGEVTISGAAFGTMQGRSLVNFDTVPALSYASWSDTQITCRIPVMDPGEIQVTVETVNGTSDAVTLTVTLPPPLQVASIDPSVGSQLSLSLDISAITGTGFEPGAAVRLEKGEVVIEALDVDVVSDTEITCNVGLFGVEPGQYDVVVINPDGEEARLEEAFTVMGACGQGAGSALLVLGLVMGLLTLAGTRLCGKRRGNISGLMV